MSHHMSHERYAFLQASVGRMIEQGLTGDVIRQRLGLGDSTFRKMVARLGVKPASRDRGGFYRVYQMVSGGRKRKEGNHVSDR